MKIAALLVATGLGLSLLPMWSVVARQMPPPGPALPPPGLDDPGVDATAPPAGKKAAAPMAPASVALPSMHGDRAAPSEDDDTKVTVHQRGDESVQEYWRGGQVYMVVVTPKNGVPYSYMLDPQGRWVDEHGQRPVRPVMYKILEWGKSKPAEASSSGG